jgi:hypothetical protein
VKGKTAHGSGEAADGEAQDGVADRHGAGEHDEGAVENLSVQSLFDTVARSTLDGLATTLPLRPKNRTDPGPVG